MSFSSCIHSKYASSGWYPASTSVSNPALTKAEAPPHNTACSPKRSVSVSSAKVVSRTPPLPPPIPLAYARATFSAFFEGFCWMAIKHGTPPPLTYSLLTRCPGPFGATMITSTSFGGTIWPKWILKP